MEKRIEDCNIFRGRRSIDEIPLKYRCVFGDYNYFNTIQTQVFNDVLYTNKTLIVSSPTGSGKTVIFELGIIQLLMELENSEYHEAFKVIYVAPTKALCSERFLDWSKKFAPLSVPCLEVTGDSEISDFNELTNATLVITTPEKWDSLTRRWKDNEHIVKTIKLLLIDEIHLLNEDIRGPILETVVSRMKTIQHALKTIKNEETDLRIIAVSATIPNIEDLAAWLGKQESVRYYRISEEHRPVKLKRYVFGYNSGSTGFKFDMSLNYKLAALIRQYSNGKPTLIFCSSRKSVEMASSVLLKDFSLTPLSDSQKSCLTEISHRLRDTKLKGLVTQGIAFHHAGLSSADRAIVEDSFRKALILILVCTNTLAVGVNLPAHLVIIKSTEAYVNGRVVEYAESTILQMIGRAGRPQYDVIGVAVIMTHQKNVAKYENLMNGCTPIESHLHKHLAEHLNSEIVLQTITDLNVAMEWIRSTFLYVRAIKCPQNYGLIVGMTRSRVEKELEEMCLAQINALESFDLVMKDRTCGLSIRSTIYGRLMARYYLSFETMMIFRNVQGSESLLEVFNVMIKCKEFCDFKIRVNEKKCLNDLNESPIRFPIKGRVKNVENKVSCLIQAVLGNLVIQEPAILQDALKMAHTADRVSKCLYEYIRLRGRDLSQKIYKALLNSIIIAKSLRARIWENSPFVSKQLKKIGAVYSTQLVNAGKTTLSSLLETDASTLEAILNKAPPFGTEIHNAVSVFPEYKITLALTGPDFAEVTITQTNNKYIPSASNSFVIVGDTDNNLLLYHETIDNIILQFKKFYRKFKLTNPRTHKITAHLIHGKLVGVDKDVSLIINESEADFKTQKNGKSKNAKNNLKASKPKTRKQSKKNTTKSTSKECKRYISLPDGDDCDFGVDNNYQNLNINSNTNGESFENNKQFSEVTDKNQNIRPSLQKFLIPQVQKLITYSEARNKCNLNVSDDNELESCRNQDNHASDNGNYVMSFNENLNQDEPMNDRYFLNEMTPRSVINFNYNDIKDIEYDIENEVVDMNMLFSKNQFEFPFNERNVIEKEPIIDSQVLFELSHNKGRSSESTSTFVTYDPPELKSICETRKSETTHFSDHNVGIESVENEDAIEQHEEHSSLQKHLPTALNTTLPSIYDCVTNQSSMLGEPHVSVSDHENQIISTDLGSNVVATNPNGIITLVETDNSGVVDGLGIVNDSVEENNATTCLLAIHQNVPIIYNRQIKEIVGTSSCLDSIVDPSNNIRATKTCLSASRYNNEIKTNGVEQKSEILVQNSLIETSLTSKKIVPSKNDMTSNHEIRSSETVVPNCSRVSHSEMEVNEEINDETVSLSRDLIIEPRTNQLDLVNKEQPTEEMLQVKATCSSCCSNTHIPKCTGAIPKERKIIETLHNSKTKSLIAPQKLSYNSMLNDAEEITHKNLEKTNQITEEKWNSFGICSENINCGLDASKNSTDERFSGNFPFEPSIPKSKNTMAFRNHFEELTKFYKNNSPFHFAPKAFPGSCSDAKSMEKQNYFLQDFGNVLHHEKNSKQNDQFGTGHIDRGSSTKADIKCLSKCYEEPFGLSNKTYESNTTNQEDRMETTLVEATPLNLVKANKNSHNDPNNNPHSDVLNLSVSRKSEISELGSFISPNLCSEVVVHMSHLNDAAALPAFSEKPIDLSVTKVRSSTEIRNNMNKSTSPMIQFEVVSTDKINENDINKEKLAESTHQLLTHDDQCRLEEPSIIHSPRTNGLEVNYEDVSFGQTQILCRGTSSSLQLTPNTIQNHVAEQSFPSNSYSSLSFSSWENNKTITDETLEPETVSFNRQTPLPSVDDTSIFTKLSTDTLGNSQPDQRFNSLIEELQTLCNKLPEKVLPKSPDMSSKLKTNDIGKSTKMSCEYNGHSTRKKKSRVKAKKFQENLKGVNNFDPYNVFDNCIGDKFMPVRKQHKTKSNNSEEQETSSRNERKYARSFEDLMQVKENVNAKALKGKQFRKLESKERIHPPATNLEKIPKHKRKNILQKKLVQQSNSVDRDPWNVREKSEIRTVDNGEIPNIDDFLKEYEVERNPSISNTGLCPDEIDDNKCTDFSDLFENNLVADRSVF